VWLDAEVKRLLVLETVSEDHLDVLVDSDELDRLLWELFLYLFRVDKQVLKERPGSLDLSDYNNDFTDLSQRFLPEVNLFFECRKISGREHGCDSNLIFFKHVKVLLGKSDHLNT